MNRYVAFLSIAILGCATDLITKAWIFSWPRGPGKRDEWWLIENFVGIQTTLNQGALFGMGQGQVSLFAGLSIVAAIGVIVWLFWFRAAQDWYLTIALSMVMGGIFGNLYDRLWFHGLRNRLDGSPLLGVRDWILFCYYDHIWPNFNIADCLLVCGAATLALHAFLYKEEKVATRPVEARG